MLITCSSCNSKYLVNSADLKPSGRYVQCGICDYQWFQNLNSIEKETLESSVQSNFKEKKPKLEQEKNPTFNLPSTYIKAKDPSIINSILIVLLLFIFIFCVWLIKNEERGIIAIFNYYVQEFYFNLKLIINDLTKLIHQIIN